VLAFVVIAGLLLAGIALVWLGCRAAPDRQEIGDQVARIGWYCIAGAIAGTILWKLIKRWLW
jgi:hypothetical protein